MNQEEKELFGKKLLNALHDFNAEADYRLFGVVFGKDWQQYMWTKFSQDCNRDMFLFLALLSGEHHKKVVAYLLK